MPQKQTEKYLIPINFEQLKLIFEERSNADFPIFPVVFQTGFPVVII
jgi:hypothetical protein